MANIVRGFCANRDSLFASRSHLRRDTKGSGLAINPLRNKRKMVPPDRIELSTSALPRE